MTRQRVLQIINKIRPTHIDQLKHHMKCRSLSSGCSRVAFELPGRIVIKFPFGSYSVRHAQKDIEIPHLIARRNRFRHLRRFCPKVFYYDHGVVAMEKLNAVGRVSYEICDMLTAVFHDTFGSRKGFDLCGDNIGRNARGQVKILDFGCIPACRR